jgi:hypothetical protein
LADESSGSSVEGAGESIHWIRARFSFVHCRAPDRAWHHGGAMGTMHSSTVDGQLAEELSELVDGSISLFVILPIFRDMLVSDSRAAVLARYEAAMSEHLVHLDGILGDLLPRPEDADGDLTASLFQSLTHLRARPACVARDLEIVGVVQQAQLCLLGSCGFALRFARSANAIRSVPVLEASLARIGSPIGQYPVSESLPTATPTRQLAYA